MKKIYKIAGLLFFTLGYFACNPLEDIHNELEDSTAKAPIEIDYTLTEDDYATSCNDNVARYNNFSSTAPPDDDSCGVVQIIDQIYYGVEGDILNVTYAYYNGSTTIDSTSAYKWKPELSGWELSPIYNYMLVEEQNTDLEYTLTDSDYKTQGESYPNFDLRNNSQEDIDTKIGNILNAQSTIQIEENNVVRVFYRTYSPATGGLDAVGYYEATLP